MERLGLDGAPDLGVRGGAERGEGVADVVREVEGDEEPERARSGPQEQRAKHVQRDRRRAVAHVGAAAREPTVRSSASAADETTEQTVPTGLSLVPPPGPAMPVIPIPMSAPSRDRAPADSAVATSGETAPWAAINSAGTPANAVLASLE